MRVRRLDLQVLFTTAMGKELTRLELLRRQGAEIVPVSYWVGRVQCQNYIAERSVQHLGDDARFFRQRNCNVETWIL